MWTKKLRVWYSYIRSRTWGYVAAIQAAKLGAKVVLIEKDKVGGTCLNRGCIPTKAFVRSSEVYSNLKDSEKYWVSLENPSIDIKKVVERKDNIVYKLVGGGAVYHDLGNLNFTFLINEDLYDLKKQLSVIIDALNSIGIMAEFNGRNDIVVDGKKISNKRNSKMA